nr:hypothetical protein [Tanacetum cinerariifolium]
MNENPDLYKESYVLYDRVMNPLVAQLERKTRKDRGTRTGRHSTSSSTFNQPSSSYPNDDDDDDDGNDEGTSRTSTPSPIRYVSSLTNEVPQVFQNPPNIDPYLEPFYTRQTETQLNFLHFAKQLLEQFFSFFLQSSSFSNNSTMNSTKASSSNPSKKIKLTIIPPRQLFVNISSDKDVTTTHSATIILHLQLLQMHYQKPNPPSKTTSTNQTSSSQENTSSSFQSKLQISPPSLNEPTSPHPLNPLLDNISDVSPRPLNPQPLQSHPSLDITLSLSPITSLDHIHDTPSPPSPPQPQPPIMSHPRYYNYHGERVDVFRRLIHSYKESIIKTIHLSGPEGAAKDKVTRWNQS